MTSPRIMIIDDHQSVRAAIRLLLQEASPTAEVEEASTAAIALRRWLERDWDLALVDLHLPDRSGIDLVRQLATIRPTARIVVVTAMSPETYEVVARAAGASGFVQKRDLSSKLVSVALDGLEPA